MLNIACVAVNLDTYMEGHAIEAVEVLFSMVRRNLQAGTQGRFTVFTDNPAAFENIAGVQTKLVPKGATGWWAKLFLFSPEAFPKGERVLYFDLDTCITGPLDEIASYQGPFAILRDVYRQNGLQSSVMAWEAGSTRMIWAHWTMAGCPQLPGGDQEWIEKMDLSPDIFQSLYPGQFKSYKLDCQEFVPRGTSVVVFHGRP